MTAYFVTATGTDIGKTYVTAGILRAAQQAGRPASAIKPVMSGYNPADSAASDAGVLLAAMNMAVTDQNIATISPWRYRAALSPNMAAVREGRELDITAVIAFCEAAIAAVAGLTLVEGAGGAMTPLNDAHSQRSLIIALATPVVLVAGTYLGTISHTLTAAAALTSHGVGIAAVILNESIESPVSPQETATTIRKFLPFTAVKIVPRDHSETAFRDVADFLINRDKEY